MTTENTTHKAAEEVVVEKIPEVTPELPVQSNSVSDDEADFFAGADNPREKYENPEKEGDAPAENPNPTISQTSQEDEQYFKLGMGLLDSNRAILLSLYVSGDMENVDKYMYYKDWNDPKHRPILEAGRVVANKYKFSAFKYLPELCLVLAIVVSSAVLFSLAKKDKAAQMGAPASDTKTQTNPNPQAAQETKPTKLKKVV